MFKRLLPLALAAAIAAGVGACAENEPEPAGGGGGGTVVDLDRDGVIEPGEPGYVDRKRDGIHNGLPDVGEKETPNEPIGPGGE